MDISQWVDGLTEEVVQELFRRKGVELIQIKALSRNHNSKNQIYLAPDLSDVPQISASSIKSNPGTSKKKRAGKPIYHAPINWFWLYESGSSQAPNAQLIYYPQYPEVRLSGLLAGAQFSPSQLLNIGQRGQEEGRLLLFGSNDNSTYGVILSQDSPANQFFKNCLTGETLFATLAINSLRKVDSRDNLCQKLSEISSGGWLDSIQLSNKFGIQKCNGPRCGGHTLEANLGIPMNGIAGPDFGNWEVKSHKVSTFQNNSTGKVTLMTPEPDLGAYSELGVAWFARHFGKLNDKGDRYDFTGIHSVPSGKNKKTRLTLELTGYDSDSRSIQDDGSISLLSENGEIVSGWSFEKLLTHWQKKHAYTVYVPTLFSKEQPRKFRYGHMVHLGSVTRFEYFLRAISAGKVVYDPGIKLELQGNGAWKAKARSQFRMNFKDLSSLYESFEEVDVYSSV